MAQTIIDSGQGAYYVHRTALPVTPRQIEAELAQLGLYERRKFSKALCGWRTNTSARRRARVRWDDSRIQLSAILKAVSDIGYLAHPFDPARSDDTHKREHNTAVARCAVERLMGRPGLRGVVRGKVIRTTIPDARTPCPLDRVNRQFRASRHNQF